MMRYKHFLKHPLCMLSLLLVLPCITVAQPAPPPKPKIAPDAAKADPNSTIPVIIQYKQDPGSDQDDQVARLGGATSATLHSIHAKAAQLPAGQLERLAGDPNVSYISIDRPVHPREAVTITAPDYTYQPVNAVAASTIHT